MLVQPQEIRDYTTIQSVIDRTDAQLTIDILQAESKLFEATGRTSNDVIFSPLPENIRIFLIKWSEYYGANSDFANAGQYKSESFDDYEYDKFDSAKVTIPDVNSLIKQYILEEDVSGKQIIFKMRVV